MPYKDVINAAHYYVDQGLPIIPVCSHDHEHTTTKHNAKCNCAGKIPLIAGWQSRKDTTETHLDEWITQFKKFNIGLPMGEASGYCGIDIDGATGEALLQEMSGGDLPDTWEFTTGGGRRLLYTIPIGMATKKFKKTGVKGEHDECALLATGQQTVLPPSIHYTGHVYTWSDNRSPRDIDCAPAPAWLLKLIKLDTPKIAPNKSTAPRGLDVEEEFEAEEFIDYIPEELSDLKETEVKSQKKSTSTVEGIIYQVISSGSRDDALTKIVGHFLSKPEYRAMPKEVFLNFMHDYNRRYMDPPLEDEAVTVKVNYFSEIEAQKSAMYKDQKTERKFQASNTAHMVMNLLKDQELLMIAYELKSNTFFTCNPQQGPWTMRSGAYLQSIRALVRKYIRLPQYGDPSWDKEHYINETLAAVKDLMLSSNAREELSFDLHDNQDALKKFIVLNGKLLDWRSGELLSWDPSYRATINFDVDYDVEATCPHWESYMKEWLPDEGSRLLIQEFFGYCLIPDTKLESFLILTGSGSNGKSMMLNFIKGLFGESCSSLSTAKMTERFGKATLRGRLVNICTEDEGEGGYLKHTDEIKALVSGEEIIAEYKGKDPFKFRNIARLIFATNNIPKTRDRTHGWYRRQIIINFPNRFAKDMNKAREMEYNMHQEKSGIFNWMLEGLRRVMDRGDLIVPESVQQNQEEFKAINDPLEGFLRECTRPMVAEDYPEGRVMKRVGISTSLLYRVYEFWCEDNYGEKAKQLKMVQRNFTERIHKEKGIGKDKGTCTIRGGNAQQCFLGIMLNIKDSDMRERMMEAFKGYGAAEMEAKLCDYIRKLS